jgi:hypothetical protein
MSFLKARNRPESPLFRIWTITAKKNDVVPFLFLGQS